MDILLRDGTGFGVTYRVREPCTLQQTSYTLLLDELQSFVIQFVPNLSVVCHTLAPPSLQNLKRFYSTYLR
jgi:hypothetical protein